MTFTITTLTPQAQWRNFLLAHEDVEEVYEFLHSIIDKGDTLVSVTMTDNNGYLPLPLDSLEQDAFLNPIGELRRQWEPLLMAPKRGYLSKQEYSRRLADARLAHIGRIRQMLIRLQALMDRAQDSLKAGPEQAMLLDHYSRLLDRHSRLLVKLETSQPRSV